MGYDYEHVNHFVLRISDTIKAVPEKRKDRFPKIDSEKTSPELIHAVKGDERQYVRKEFWKVVHELQVMYHVSRFDAIVIRISEFASLNLNREENGTAANVALFRVACWKAGESKSRK